MSIFGNGNRLTAQALEELSAHVDMLDCECPTHLIGILQKVRAFAEYTNECIEKFPEDAQTHKWLYSSAQNLDALISGTIAQLARVEGFVDDQNAFVPRQRSTDKN